MAQKILVHLVDDFDETVIENGNGRTVTFGLDGTNYEIDLTTEHAGELRKALSPYLQAARPVGGKAGGRSVARQKRSSENHYSSKAVREWAKANKIEVSSRGRIRQSVVEEFRKAGN